MNKQFYISFGTVGSSDNKSYLINNIDIDFNELDKTMSKFVNENTRDNKQVFVGNTEKKTFILTSDNTSSEITRKIEESYINQTFHGNKSVSVENAEQTAEETANQPVEQSTKPSGLLLETSVKSAMATFLDDNKDKIKFGNKNNEGDLLELSTNDCISFEFEGKTTVVMIDEFISDSGDAVLSIKTRTAVPPNETTVWYDIELEPKNVSSIDWKTIKKVNCPVSVNNEESAEVLPVEKKPKYVYRRYIFISKPEQSFDAISGYQPPNNKVYYYDLQEKKIDKHDSEPSQDYKDETFISENKIEPFTINNNDKESTLTPELVEQSNIGIGFQKSTEESVKMTKENQEEKSDKSAMAYDNKSYPPVKPSRRDEILKEREKNSKNAEELKRIRSNIEEQEELNRIRSNIEAKENLSDEQINPAESGQLKAKENLANRLKERETRKIKNSQEKTLAQNVFKGVFDAALNTPPQTGGKRRKRTRKNKKSKR
jgi:hypothetical protein